MQRYDAAIDADEVAAGLMGLELGGNFLFDPAERQDFRSGLLALGAAEGELGDLWLRGDRGAQAILTAAQAAALDGRTAVVRTVEVALEARPCMSCNFRRRACPAAFKPWKPPCASMRWPLPDSGYLATAWPS